MSLAAPCILCDRLTYLLNYQLVYLDMYPQETSCFEHLW